MRLLELRKNVGLTQNAIAKDLNISVQSYCNYEKEQRSPTPEMLVKLANYFSVSVDYLLGHSENTGLSPKEKKLGYSESVNLQLSIDEYNMVIAYRDLGKKKGPAYQALVREHLDRLLNI